MSDDAIQGKTTQVPQFILDHFIDKDQYEQCNIICTQPRRLSAMSVAQRVAAERGERIGETVGYSIRMESKTSNNTKLLFCTTGSMCG
jgi:HrpA-like RNA helicase